LTLLLVGYLTDLQSLSPTVFCHIYGPQDALACIPEYSRMLSMHSHSTTNYCTFSAWESRPESSILFVRVSRVLQHSPLIHDGYVHFQREYQQIRFRRHCPLMSTLLYVCFFLSNIVNMFSASTRSSLSETSCHHQVVVSRQFQIGFSILMPVQLVPLRTYCLKRLS
jgi:hypothetical protein